MLTESREEFSDLHSIFRLRALRYCDGADVESPCPLFFSFSASFKNLAQENRSEISLRFVTSGLSLCLYPLLSQNIIFSLS